MTHRLIHLRTVAGLLMALLVAGYAAAAGIVDTVHNLSISGPGPVKSTTEGEICIFCHAPHNARRDIPYLWNRNDSTVSYIPYQSSTLHAAVGQPTGASKMCLSCHDGTVALGALVTRPQEVPFAGGVRFIPPGRTNVGVDLSDDHPVSMPYDASLVAANGQLVDPSALPAEVRLDQNHQMQCTACHDPHENSIGRFLVMSNRNSAICGSCHSMNGWTQTPHANSGRTWNGAGADPWPDSTYTTVAENACGSCHRPHAAPKPQRLLNRAIDEDNCLVCHTGNVASKNIGPELLKTYGHFVQNYNGIHDPAENFAAGGVTRHVECVDCHNPHQANAAAATAPRVAGANAGVRGVGAGGQAVDPALNLYEICFNCHATTNFRNTAPIARQIAQTNTRLEFDSANPSFHPVVAARNNTDVPSLIAPLTRSSQIYCTDCHGNNVPTGIRGPHGSSNKYLLVRNYTTTDNTTETATAYALCYGCHSRTSILGDASFKEHQKHIQGEKAPCSACHDAHGVSITQGNPVNNSALINFDLAIVKPNSKGLLYFQDTGTFKGRCYLLCHGQDHNPETYP